MRVRNRSRRECSRGQSLVEFALVVPLFLVIVMGIADFGLGLKTWISMTNSAREAARYAAVNCAAGTASDSDVQQRALDSATTLGLITSEVTVENCTAGASSESVVVTIEHDYELITPLGGFLSLFGGGLSSSIPLTSRADMRME
jgi:Flp pilus assembly protein TadG